MPQFSAIGKQRSSAPLRATVKALHAERMATSRRSAWPLASATLMTPGGERTGEVPLWQILSILSRPAPAVSNACASVAHRLDPSYCSKHECSRDLA